MTLRRPETLTTAVATYIRDAIVHGSSLPASGCLRSPSRRSSRPRAAPSARPSARSPTAASCW